MRRRHAIVGRRGWGVGDGRRHHPHPGTVGTVRVGGVSVPHPLPACCEGRVGEWMRKARGGGLRIAEGGGFDGGGWRVEGCCHESQRALKATLPPPTAPHHHAHLDPARRQRRRAPPRRQTGWQGWQHLPWGCRRRCRHRRQHTVPEAVQTRSLHGLMSRGGRRDSSVVGISWDERQLGSEPGSAWVWSARNEVATTSGTSTSPPRSSHTQRSPTVLLRAAALLPCRLVGRMPPAGRQEGGLAVGAAATG